jgi:hypothetical protein
MQLCRVQLPFADTPAEYASWLQACMATTRASPPQRVSRANCESFALKVLISRVRDAKTPSARNNGAKAVTC